MITLTKSLYVQFSIHSKGIRKPAQLSYPIRGYKAHAYCYVPCLLSILPFAFGYYSYTAHGAILRGLSQLSYLITSSRCFAACLLLSLKSQKIRIIALLEKLVSTSKSK